MYAYETNTDTELDSEFGNCTSCAIAFTEDYGNGDGTPIYGLTRSGKGICADCANDKWTYAHCCDVFVLDRYFNSDYDLCERCIDNHYFTCHSCDQMIHNDHYSQDGYCEGCWEDDDGDYREGIHGYHSGVPWGERTFHSENGKTYEHEQDGTITYYGIEFECEDIGHDYMGTLHTLESGWYAHAESDGSLDNGFEVITEPATYGEWMSGNMGQVMRSFHANMIELGATFEAHTVGAHCHVSRVAFTDDNHLARFAIFGTHNAEYMRSISGRTSSERYAHLEKYDGKTRQFRNAIKRRMDDRSRWCNLTNRHTVEVRLFAGSNNFDDYLAHIEWITALIEYTRDLSANECLLGALLSQTFTQYLADSDYQRAHKLALSRVPVSHLM